MTPPCQRTRHTPRRYWHLLETWGPRLALGGTLVCLCLTLRNLRQADAYLKEANAYLAQAQAYRVQLDRRQRAFQRPPTPITDREPGAVIRDMRWTFPPPDCPEGWRPLGYDAQGYWQCVQEKTP